MVFSPTTIKEHELYLVISKPEDLRYRNIDLIKKVSMEGYSIIIVTTNQLAEILRKSYEKNGIDLDKIYFVDTVTKYALGRNPDEIPQCRFINNPANLTDIGIAVTETLKSLQGKKVCMLLDSINSMLIYLSSQNITKFIHFITNKIRLLNFTGIFLAMEKGLDPDVFTQLVTFVDEVIDMDEESLDPIQDPGPGSPPNPPGPHGQQQDRPGGSGDG